MYNNKAVEANDYTDKSWGQYGIVLFIVLVLFGPTQLNCLGFIFKYTIHVFLGRPRIQIFLVTSWTIQHSVLNCLKYHDVDVLIYVKVIMIRIVSRFHAVNSPSRKVSGLNP